jgi:hypothetical protein
MIAFALLVAEYIQTFFGYSVAQLLVVMSLVLLWTSGRARAPAEPLPPQAYEAQKEAPVAGRLPPLSGLLLLYLAGTMNWGVRANLELRKRQVAQRLRRARRRLRIRRP